MRSGAIDTDDQIAIFWFALRAVISARTAYVRRACRSLPRFRWPRRLVALDGLRFESVLVDISRYWN